MDTPISKEKLLERVGELTVVKRPWSWEGLTKRDVLAVIGQAPTLTPPPRRWDQSGVGAGGVEKHETISAP